MTMWIILGLLTAFIIGQHLLRAKRQGRDGDGGSYGGDGGGSSGDCDGGGDGGGDCGGGD